MIRKMNLLKRLDSRLIAIICLTIIPVNILAITLSSITLHESHERTELFYRSEFNSLLQETTESCRALYVWWEDFISDNLKPLSIQNEFSAVKSISMINSMASVLPSNNLHGFFFLHEKYGEQQLLLKNSGGELDPHTVITVREELLQILPVTSSGISIIEICSKPYYLFQQDFRNYTLGVLLDLSKMAARIRNNSILAGSTLYLSDRNLGYLLQPDKEAVYISVSEYEKLLSRSHASGSLGVEGLGLDALLIYSEEKTAAVPAYIALEILAIASILLIILLWRMIRKEVIHPIGILQSGIETLEQNGFAAISDNARTEDFSRIFTSFNQMAEEIRSSHEKDLKLLRSELDNLKLQVNPHMLLNSLTMIYSMAETGQDNLIQRFTMNLVNYFRYCLKETNSLVSLSAELKFVENYLELQKIRYPGEISGNYYVEEGLEAAKIPPLLIQNFVENATKYARLPKTTVEVLIWVRRKAGGMAITIQDTGKGIEPDLLETLNAGEDYMDTNGVRHIGIWNCKRRLAAFFGNDASITIASEKGSGTSVEIRMPLIWEESHESSDCG